MGASAPSGRTPVLHAAGDESGSLGNNPTSRDLVSGMTPYAIRARKIDALPVLERDRAVGMLTGDDVLKALVTTLDEAVVSKPGRCGAGGLIGEARRPCLPARDGARRPR